MIFGRGAEGREGRMRKCARYRCLWLWPKYIATGYRSSCLWLKHMATGDFANKPNWLFSYLKPLSLGFDFTRPFSPAFPGSTVTARIFTPVCSSCRFIAIPQQFPEERRQGGSWSCENEALLKFLHKILVYLIYEPAKNAVSFALQF